MKKLVTSFLLIFSFLSFSPAGAAPSSSKSELVFYNWTAYFDPEVQAEFERKYNIKIREEYYQSADQRDEKLLRNGGKGFDVIMLGGPYVTTYARRGWIVPLA